MRGQWIECVPNFSEGRDRETVLRIAAAVRSAGGLVLDIHMDADHNRSVITFAAHPDAVVEAAFRAVAQAVSVIDLSRHAGVHPRVGVADVAPFVPVAGVSREECVAAAVRLGGRLATELGLPVYLYEWAARREEHRNLADVRRAHAATLLAPDGEGAPELSPDLGPRRPHPTAGAVVVGARAPLVAFNCYLSAPDPALARRIARATRERGGGPKGVKALGLWLERAGEAQVSMNITDVKTTPPHVAVDHVRRLARAYGADVARSELVGLLPLDSVLRAAASVAGELEGGLPPQGVLGAAAHALGLAALRAEQVIELAIERRNDNLELDDFLADLASASPAPGGGAASALAGSLAAALTSMVCNLTAGRPKYSAVDAEMRRILEESERLRLRLRELMQADEDAYSALMTAYKLPKETMEQQATRASTIESTLKKAADVPMECADACLEALRLLLPVAEGGNKNAISDAGAASLLAEAAGRAALLNVRTNASLMKDRVAAQSYVDRMKSVEQQIRETAARALSVATSRIG